jgi:hypothetical protein
MTRAPIPRSLVERTVTWFAALTALAAAAVIPVLSMESVLSVVRRAVDRDSLAALRVACIAYVVVALVAILSRRRIGAAWEALVADYQARSVIEYPALPVHGSRWFERLPLIGAVAIGVWAMTIAFVNPTSYLGMVQEDHLIENGSVVFWVLGALAGIVGLVRGTRKSRARTLAYLGLIALCIMCGGEEISWGQRIFHFRGPDFLIATNKQRETNLHNIGSIAIFAHFFFLLGLTLFWVLPRVLERSRGMSNYFRSWDFPIINADVPRVYVATLITWVVIGIRFGTLGFTPFSLWGYYNQADDEIFETMAAYCYSALIVLDVLARARERAAEREDCACPASTDPRPAVPAQPPPLSGHLIR